jgi:tripartite-type tricarboxylate transporter receptor subunit TctC
MCCAISYLSSLTYAGSHRTGDTSMTAIFRGRVAAALTAALLLALSAPVLQAQTGTTKIIVPYPPGSGPDILSRLMAEQIGKAEGQTVVIENRPGGGTLIGTEAAARAAPDGNTVLLVANSFVVNPALKKGNYDVSKSFEPVCYLAATPMVLVVLGTSPYKTLNDLIAGAREKPGQVVFASAGRPPRCTWRSRCSSAPPTSPSPMCRMPARRHRSTR